LPTQAAELQQAHGDSDDELVRQVAGGDQDACRALVERHLGRVVAFAARTLGDAAEAEDVAQDTFLRLWSHAAKWQPGTARLSTWLHRVALNLCLDRLRRRPHLPLDDAPEPVDPRPEMSTALHRREVAARVNSELMRLTDAQRAALTLCHYQGIRNYEAADMMGITVEALESLLARARRTLRERLRPLAGQLLEDA
jgi:RNA polymerase sigma-70 factor (ECF subfamily)